MATRKNLHRSPGTVNKYEKRISGLQLALTIADPAGSNFIRPAERIFAV